MLSGQTEKIFVLSSYRVLRKSFARVINERFVVNTLRRGFFEGARKLLKCPKVSAPQREHLGEALRSPKPEAEVGQDYFDGLVRR